MDAVVYRMSEYVAWKRNDAILGVVFVGSQPCLVVGTWAGNELTHKTQKHPVRSVGY